MFCGERILEGKNGSSKTSWVACEVVQVADDSGLDRKSSSSCCDKLGMV